MLKLLAISALCLAASAAPVYDLSELPDAALYDAKYPKLAALLRRARADPMGVAALIRSHPKAAVARAADFAGAALRVAPAAGRRSSSSSSSSSSPAPVPSLPVVVAHGMGDSCFNAGMKQITAEAGTRVGAYSVCIPTGDNDITDTIYGFLMNMDRSVDVFAEKVKANAKLAKGFNAFGLSQGNNLIMGYIKRYHTNPAYPAVRNFMSICGIQGGVATPECHVATPILGSLCEVVAEVLGDFAYDELIQDVLFQANYYRDPMKLNDTKYLANSQLSKWNCETPAPAYNTSYRAGFLKTSRYIWVEGLQDSVVTPREGEQWGQLMPGQYADKNHSNVLPMKRSTWWTTDSFGLASAGKMNKHNFESFNGDHIRFTDAELMAWLDKYFKA